MANWFESSPARAVIIHTIIVAGAVWAAFAFIFDDNKVAVYKAQAEQYKAKTEVLEVELARLRDENRKYLDWLNSSPATIPYLEAQLKASTEELARYRTQLAGTATATSSASGDLVTVPYAFTSTIGLGETFIDKRTRVAVGLAGVSVNRTASLTLTLPGTQTREFSEVKPGTVWTFSHAGKSYQVTLQRVDWYTNKTTIAVNEVPTTN